MKKQKSMFEQIVSLDNISKAYMDVYTKFTELCKGNKYNALDGATLYDEEVFVDDLLNEIQNELKSFKQLKPAAYNEIPKKSGELRGIYKLPIKERIKCQAIFRVLDPFFENTYSDYLYSFRSSHPSYYASRSTRRLYLRNYKKGDMYVLKMDISDYSDYHNHKYLENLFKKYNLEPEVIKLINLYIKVPYYKDGTIASRSIGTMQGMNLCPIFNNIYISYLDDYIGEKVYFYRRVGDDFIMFDRDKKKLEELRRYIEKETKKIGLIIKKEKTIFTKITESFEFLGLSYNKGIISLPEVNFNRIVKGWKKKLKFDEKLNEKYRKRKLIKFIQNRNRKDFVNKDSTTFTFKDLVFVYNLVNDTEQIKRLSKIFFNILVKYFNGKLNFKNIKKTKKILSTLDFPMLTKIHRQAVTGTLKKKERFSFSMVKNLSDLF